MGLTKEDFMKLGLERCAELLADIELKNCHNASTYLICPYTNGICFRYRNCFGCEHNPLVSVKVTTTSNGGE